MISLYGDFHMWNFKKIWGKVAMNVDIKAIYDSYSDWPRSILAFSFSFAKAWTCSSCIITLYNLNYNFRSWTYENSLCVCLWKFERYVEESEREISIKFNAFVRSAFIGLSYQLSNVHRIHMNPHNEEKRIAIYAAYITRRIGFGSFYQGYEIHGPFRMWFQVSTR